MYELITKNFITLINAWGCITSDAPGKGDNGSDADDDDDNDGVVETVSQRWYPFLMPCASRSKSKRPQRENLTLSIIIEYEPIACALVSALLRESDDAISWISLDSIAATNTEFRMCIRWAFYQYFDFMPGGIEEHMLRTGCPISAVLEMNRVMKDKQKCFSIVSNLPKPAKLTDLSARKTMIGSKKKTMRTTTTNKPASSTDAPHNANSLVSSSSSSSLSSPSAPLLSPSLPLSPAPLQATPSSSLLPLSISTSTSTTTTHRRARALHSPWYVGVYLTRMPAMGSMPTWLRVKIENSDNVCDTTTGEVAPPLVKSDCRKLARGLVATLFERGGGTTAWTSARCIGAMLKHRHVRKWIDVDITRVTKNQHGFLHIIGGYNECGINYACATMTLKRPCECTRIAAPMRKGPNYAPMKHKCSLELPENPPNLMDEVVPLIENVCVTELDSVFKAIALAISSRTTNALIERPRREACLQKCNIPGIVQITTTYEVGTSIHTITKSFRGNWVYDRPCYHIPSVTMYKTVLSYEKDRMVLLANKSVLAIEYGGWSKPVYSLIQGNKIDAWFEPTTINCSKSTEP